MLLNVNPWKLCLITKTRTKVLKFCLRLLRVTVTSPYHPFLPQQLLLPRKVNFQKRQSSWLHRQDIAAVSIQCIHCRVTLFPNVFTIGTQVGMQWCLSQASLHSHFFLPMVYSTQAHQLHLLSATAAVQVIARWPWGSIQGMQIHRGKKQRNSAFGCPRL